MEMRTVRFTGHLLARISLPQFTRAIRPASECSSLQFPHERNDERYTPFVYGTDDVRIAWGSGERVCDRTNGPLRGAAVQRRSQIH